MTITASELTTGSSASVAASYATASVTPHANRLQILDVVSRRTAGAATEPTVSGDGLTWVKVTTIALDLLGGTEAQEGANGALTNPTRVVAADGSYATAALTAGQTKGERYGNLGFDAIPASATITSVVIEYLTKTTGATLAQGKARCFYKVGGVAGSNHDHAFKSYGDERATVDVTSGRSWARADLLNGTFEVALQGVSVGGAPTISFDYFKVTVGYTDSGIDYLITRWPIAPDTYYYRLTRFRALGASPTTGTLTISFGATNQDGCLWTWAELDGVDTSGTNGSGAIADTQTATCYGDTTLAFDAGDLTDINQRSFSAFFRSVSAEAALPGLLAEEVSDKYAVGMAVETNLSLIDTVGAGWATNAMGVAIGNVIQPAALYGSGPTDWPEFHLELSTADPYAPAQTWNDISDDVRQATVEWGRSNEEDDFQTGTQTYVLRNTSGDYRRSNTAGRFYGNLKKLRKVRSYLVWKGERHWLAHGQIESLTPTREANYSEVELRCNDYREQLASRFITSAAGVILVGEYDSGQVTVTTTHTAFNPRAQFKATKTPGSVSEGAGTDIQVESSNSVTSNSATRLTYDDTGKLIVQLRTDGSGNSLTTADELCYELNQAPAIFPRNVNASSGALYGTRTRSGVVQPSDPIAMVGGLPQELTGARVNRALDAVGWGPHDRLIDYGEWLIQGMAFAVTDQVAVADHLRDVGKTEYGQLFVDPLGRVVFQARSARAAAPFDTPLFTVTDTTPAAGEYRIPDGGLVPLEDSTFIHTNVSVNRANGGTYTATADAAHLLTYGTRDYAFSTLLAADADLNDLADAVLAAHQDETDRYESVTVDPWIAGTALIDLIVQATVSTRITVKESTAPGSSALESDHHIEGVRHEFTLDRPGFRWQTTYRLSPAA